MSATLGCIGCGNMGTAILKGLASREDLTLVGLDQDKAKVQALGEELGVKPAESLLNLVQESDYILVAVKPAQVGPLLEEIAPRLQTRQVVISIAAGISLTQLKTHSGGGSAVVRVMPNTPAMVCEGVCALCFDDPDLKATQADFVAELFKPLGQAHVLAESAFDAFTAVVGSGPAYVFYFMEALVEAGVTLGLQRPMATEMVKGLFSGSAKLAQQDAHLSVLREMVTSPAGTTIAATNVLDNSAVRGAIVSAVKAACERSKELGK